jgi:tRNA-dihydrouridine synthase B
MSVAESAISQTLPQIRPLSIGPLSIGSVEIGFPVVQAALSGYSDWAMRVIARRLGAPYTLCEVMLDQFITQHGHTKKNRGRMHVSEEEHPVGGQLMGAST